MEAEDQDPRGSDKSEGSKAEEGEPPRPIPADPQEGELPARIPPDDSSEDETKHYVVGRNEGSLQVIATGEGISTRSAPADIVAGLVDHVFNLVKEFNAGRVMLRSAQASNSMVFEFDDPEPEELQTTLPVQQTLSAARQVAELIDLEGDELFTRAIEMGPATASYAELASFVATRSLTLKWTPRGEEPRTLDDERAGRQYRRLSADPEMSEQKMTINGKLYKVITIESEKPEGSIGVHLFRWSLAPPGFKKGSKVTVYYDDPVMEAEIRDGLLGQPVSVDVRLRQPLQGSTVINPNRIHRELISIAEGDGEDSDLGTPIDDLDDEEG